MATTKFNAIILAAARRLKTPRAAATTDVEPYTSAILTEYANRAVRDMLTEHLKGMGEARFAEFFPEYVKESGALALSTGVTAKPSDALLVLDVVNDTKTLKFYKLAQPSVQSVRAGIDKLIVPSATRPVFFEENALIQTLGVTTGNIIARYIQTHQDISPIITAAGNGNFNTAAGSWTASSRTLAATMNAAFVAGDMNKRIMFRSATVVYAGWIERQVTAGSVVVRGDGLPTANITAGNVIDVMVSDLDPDASDLKLNAAWHGAIIDRMVALAMADARVTNPAM